MSQTVIDNWLSSLWFEEELSVQIVRLDLFNFGPPRAISVGTFFAKVYQSRDLIFS